MDWISLSMKLRMDRARTPRPRSSPRFVVSALARGRRGVGVDRERRARRRGPANRTSVMGPNLMNADQLTRWFNTKRARPARAASSGAQQRRPRARADLHRRRPHGERARRHRVRAVGDRDRLVRVPRRGPDPTGLQQLRGHQREQRAAQRHDLRGRGTRRARRSRAASRRRRSVSARRSNCCAATRTRCRATCPTACACRRAIASGSRRGGSTSVGTVRPASSSGRPPPTTAIRILQLFSGALMFNGMPALGGYPDVTTPDAIAQRTRPRARSRGSTFTVGWWGQDFESGIAGFNVDVSDNGGPWIRWLDATAPVGSSRPRRAATSRSSGVAGHTYTFRVQAVDHAGNAVRSGRRRSRRPCRVRRAARRSSRRRTRWGAAASCRHCRARR